MENQHKTGSYVEATMDATYNHLREQIRLLRIKYAIALGIIAMQIVFEIMRLI